MARYILQRLVTLIAILFVVSIGSFYLIHLLPGDPVFLILGFNYSPVTKAILDAQLGLNQPIYLQYFTWIGHVLHGNLGTSFISHQSVGSTIMRALPIDGELIIISQILAFGAAIPLAMKAARNPDSVLDRILSAGSFVLLSVPGFIVIIFLVLFVSIKLGVPNTGPATYVPFLQNPLVNLTSLMLPSLTIAIGAFVLYFRVLRSDLTGVLQEEFITMARSKGISTRRIMWRHAFRPASVALLGTAGVNIGGALAAGFIVQFLLAIPGLGFTLVTAINANDYLLVQGIVLVISAAVVIVNFIFDFIIFLVDPRIARD
jgi:peptide/nickel transport system permease protein